MGLTVLQQIYHFILCSNEAKSRELNPTDDVARRMQDYNTAVCTSFCRFQLTHSLFLENNLINCRNVKYSIHSLLREMFYKTFHVYFKITQTRTHKHQTHFHVYIKITHTHTHTHTHQAYFHL